MSRISRLISVLQLFESDRPVWTVDEISQALDISVSTAYRQVRELVTSGFLDPVTGAGYALGPAFIRYDRIFRQSDTLIRVADPVMKALLDRNGQNGTVALCRRFKDCVMCVYEVQGRHFQGPTSYERGVAMPIYLGATSKIILAHLPDRMLKSVYLANEKTIRNVLRTQDWSEFKAQLREICRAGFALTESEVAEGRTGLAAPIARNGQVFASISLIVEGKRWDDKKLKSLVPHVLAAAARISQSLSPEMPFISRG